MSLLCVRYKILKKLIHTRIKPIIDSLFLVEQAEFRRERSSKEQAISLTQNVEGCFKVKRKAGAVPIEFTAIYDIIWHLWLHLLTLLPDKHMIQMITDFI